MDTIAEDLVKINEQLKFYRKRLNHYWILFAYVSNRVDSITYENRIIRDEKHIQRLNERLGRYFVDSTIG